MLQNIKHFKHKIYIYFHRLTIFLLQKKNLLKHTLIFPNEFQICFSEIPVKVC